MGSTPFARPKRQYQGDSRRAEGSLLHVYTSAVTWKPPLHQYGMRGKKQFRIYACPPCKDVGVVVLPRYRKGEVDGNTETPGSLMAVYLGTGIAHYCPACRAAASVYRMGLGVSQGREYDVVADQAHHPRWVQARLAHWLELKRAQIAEEEAEDAPTKSEVKAAVEGGVAAVNKGVPRQSSFEVDEEADTMRREKGGD